MLRVASRTVLRSSLRTSRMSVVATPRYARFESTAAPASHAASVPDDLKKQRLREQDALQRDWDATVLSYEELKPRTEQPNSVSIFHFSRNASD